MGRRGLAGLRRPVGGGRQGLRGHEQRRAPRPGAAERPGRRHGVRRGDRRLPLADDPREAHLRPGQRLAPAGRLLDALRRGQPPLLHLQPGHPRLPRHRGDEGRQRRARDRREGEGADRRGRGVGVRHDGGARRLPAQPRGELPARGGRDPLRHHRERRRRGPRQHPRADGAELRRGRGRHRQARLGEQPARRQDPARHVVEPGLRCRQGPAAGDLPGRRRLGLQLRAEDREAALEVRRQPQGLGVGARAAAARATTSSRPRSSGRTRSTSASARTRSTGRASATSGRSTPASTAT